MSMYERTELLLGARGVYNLKKASVAVFGVGGVGSFACEALVRAGIGRLVLVDGDTVAESNINRQLIATTKTVGQSKAFAMEQRAKEISPETVVDAQHIFYTADNADKIDFSSLDYIIDAIDTVSSKLIIIERAKSAGVPVISCMGAGNKLDPTRFQVADISKTSVCPLARVMRYELRKRGIKDVKVVFSTEEAVKPEKEIETAGRRQTPGSLSFVPSVAGLIAAGEVIRHIAGKRDS